MLVCPKCKCEYEEGYTFCNDCNCKLVHVPEVSNENIIVNNKVQKKIGLTVRSLISGIVFVIGIIILMSSINLADA